MLEGLGSERLEEQQFQILLLNLEDSTVCVRELGEVVNLFPGGGDKYAFKHKTLVGKNEFP